MGRVSNARERLLDSALVLMHARSYESVGVQELCEHAGVKKGSFYHFFPSKEALTVALLQRQWGRLRAQLRKEVLRPGLPIRARVQRFVALHGRSQHALRQDAGCTPGCCFGNLAAELSTLSDPIRRTLERIFAEQAAVLEQVLADAVRAGELGDIDASEAARAVVAFVQGALILTKLHDRPDVFDALSPHALQLLAPLPTAITHSPSEATESPA